MATEKSFLQTIKLDISRSFKLVPYERVAFHRILGILKSDIGRDILIRELEKGPEIRSSALSILRDFDGKLVLSTLLAYLGKNISSDEKIYILDFLENRGSAENIREIIEFIEREKTGEDSLYVLSKAFRVANKIASESDDLLNYYLSIVNSDEYTREIKNLAILGLSSFRVLSYFEEILKKGNEDEVYSVYRALFLINRKHMNEMLQRKQQKQESNLFTYDPENEDKIVLDIRVLLGKMTHYFDSYSNRVKAAFISAVISSNHREFPIYTMKALTSGDAELVNMTLYVIYKNITLLRDPDKLFRNLIAISTETVKEDELIVDVFVKYFTTPNNTRQFNVLKDKMYNYIVVTLETYFETYRKEFMITDVAENSFPENFQKIRKFILEKMNAGIRKDLVFFLQSEEAGSIHRIVSDISGKIDYITEKEEESLALLIEILFDSDKKSRENSASRIEDINFEKRYLRNRIVRLCRIIGRLGINTAATPLVNMYNYLKKYPDPEIIDAAIHSLSMLNYSYMLGEIEVQLNTGSPEDQLRALQLISLFTEQRSLNILFEFLQGRIGEDSPIVKTALSILIERDILNNVSANAIFRKMIEESSNPEICSLAILGIGRCGQENDVAYLNDLFYRIESDQPNEFIVRAVGEIMTGGDTYNRRELIRNLQEYLKDPGIRVRIYACLLLVKLGNKDSLKSIRDMLIIKNKGIQRDILTIIGDLKTIEFSFFLVSLLKEEYGMIRDIIHVLRMLPPEELKEIDAFIVNIFRKFESPDMGELIEETHEIIKIQHLIERDLTVVYIEFPENNSNGSGNLSELINFNIRTKELISGEITAKDGVVSELTNSRITAFFRSSEKAVDSSMKIIKNIKAYNRQGDPDKNINVSLRVITGPVRIIQDELIFFSEYRFEKLLEVPLFNTVIVDNQTAEAVKDLYALRPVSGLVYTDPFINRRFSEVVTPMNFQLTAEKIISHAAEEEQKKKLLREQLESEMKKIRKGARTPSSIAIAKELDELGMKIQKELNDIERYVQRRTTDRELIKNVRQMLINIDSLYKVEVSKIMIE